MNNLQAFVTNEKNLHRLIYVLATDDCESCPAFSFCKRDSRRASPKYDDCGDAFTAWALTKKKRK